MAVNKSNSELVQSTSSHFMNEDFDYCNGPDYARLRTRKIEKFRAKFRAVSPKNNFINEFNYETG